MVDARIPPRIVREFAPEDFKEIVDNIRELTEVVGIEFEMGELTGGDDDNLVYPVWATGTLKLSDGSTMEQIIEYLVQGDDIYMGLNMPALVRIVRRKISHRPVTSSRRVVRRSILGAEGDDMYDDAFDEQETAEAFDDLTDAVDDIQEVMDDIEPDDIDIEMDNNITNHYIVECDECQEVFISAMAETNPTPEFISGICPLCDKESEQVIKWIVREVDNEQ